MTDFEVQKENRRRWVEALLSGKYAQTKGVLHNDQGFCCLGVWCDVVSPFAEDVREGKVDLTMQVQHSQIDGIDALCIAWRSQCEHE